MTKQELENKELYTLISNMTMMPYTPGGDFFVLFTEKEKAVALADKLNSRLIAAYRNSPVRCCLIKNNEKFFKELIYLGYSSFLYNGEGAVYSLKELYGIDFTLPEDEELVYSSYMRLSCLDSSKHIGSVKEGKIAGLKLFLYNAENKPITDKFINKQKDLARCYEAVQKIVSPTKGITAPMPGTYPPVKELNVEDIPAQTESIVQPVQEAKNAGTINPPGKEKPEEQILEKEKAEVTAPQKIRRPVVAVIMYVFCALFFIIAFGMEKKSDKLVCLLTAICYMNLGTFMLKMYVKRFGYIFFSVLCLPFISMAFCDGEIGVAVFFCVIALIPLLLFIWANFSKKAG